VSAGGHSRSPTMLEDAARERVRTAEDRVLDLAKGLQAHFEPDIPYTPLSEWLHLARRLAEVFANHP
jgi:hypothetical protein